MTTCSLIELKRREFIALIGSAARAWPLAAHAQSTKMPTIGALVIGNINPEQFWREFRQGLRDLGYVEGQTFDLSFDRRKDTSTGFPNWPTSWSVSSRYNRHLVHAHRPGGKASDARNPDRHGRDRRPDGTGLVASLPRPGGNVTGIASVAAEAAKVCNYPRDAAGGAPGDGSGQCNRSLLQTFPRTNNAWRRSHRNYDQPC